LHTDKKLKDIIREKNEKFFQYYRKKYGGALSDLALNIDDIKTINPYIGIDKVEIITYNNYVIPRNNGNLFEYYKYVNDNRKTMIGFFISEWKGNRNNTSIINVCKGEGNNSIAFGNCI
jgi:hypothetical protein